MVEFQTGSPPEGLNLCPMTFPWQGTDAGSVYAYPPPAYRIANLCQCSYVCLRCLALRVPVLVINAPAATFEGPGGPTACLIKVLFDVLSGTGFNFGQNSDMVASGVHCLGFVRHPLALTVTHGVFPTIAPVLSVTLLSCLVAHCSAIHSTAYKIVRKIQRWRLQWWPVAQ